MGGGGLGGLLASNGVPCTPQHCNVSACDGKPLREHIGATGVGGEAPL